MAITELKINRLTTNIVQILGKLEFNRNDLYRFNDFPWYAKPKLNYKIDNSNNFIFVRSAKNENFWTTCFNAPNICANHDKKLEFKLIGKRLFIYDLSK